MHASLSLTIAPGRPSRRASPPTRHGQNAATVRWNANTTRNAAENGNPVTSPNTARR